MRNPDQFQHDPDVVITQTQGKPTITTHVDTALADVVHVANRSYEWTKTQIHAGLQDFVSRVLYGEAAHEHGKEKEVEREHERGRDR